MKKLLEHSFIMKYLHLLKTNCLVCVSIFYHLSALSAQNITPIDYLGIEHGLSNSAVTCIYQDHNDFIWFGTYDGLNRYDGYDFKIFRNRYGDANSLIHNWIITITEDQKHRLWVGTRQGVCVYNMVSDNFTPTSYHLPNNKNLLPVTGYTKDIKIDRSGNVFIAIEYEGLLLFDKDNFETGTLLPFPAMGSKAEHYNVTALCVSPDQTLWMVVENKGLCIFDRKQKCIRLINPEIRSAYCMLFDKNFLWIANSTGLNRYNVSSNKIELTYTVSTNQLTSSHISSLLKSNNNELWITTDGGGINILNINSGQFKYILSGNDKFSLTSNAISSLLCDKESRKWIGTLRGGINIVDPNKSNFLNISHNPASANSLTNNFVLSLCEQSPEKLWIGTDGGGVSVWNRKTNQFTNYKHIPGDDSSLPSKFITKIIKDRYGDMWLATYDGGISRFIPSSGKFITYLGINPGNAPPSAIFWQIYEDKDGNLWAASIQYGMFLFNREANRLELFDPLLKDILVLKEDKSGQLWGGDWTSLIRIDMKHKKYQHYPMNKPVRSIFEDRKGNFWVGTGAGLVLFDRKQNKPIKKYTTENGLGSDQVLNIQEDRVGNLWLSTYNGLSCFNVAKQTFRTYSPTDGLPSKEFNFNASLALQSGELAFGCIKGLSLFYPDKISQVRNDPNIVISGLKINNLPVSQSRKYISKRNNDEVLELKVPYNEAIFTFEFTAIEYPYAERINYRYKMEGWDRTWINPGSVRSATYTNLAPGNYTFVINCTNRDGAWIKKQVAIHIIVLPPWYKTWWAFLIYTLIFIALIYWYLTYKLKQTRLEYEVKLARANEKKQKIIQEKEREIHENRLDFFTSISHEFRAPLSLIINPIKDMLTRPHTGDDQDLKIIYRNARRLLSLVDQLLLFRKADSGRIQMKVVPLNIYQLCREVYLCFNQQAKSANIHYDFLTEYEDITIYADREKLEIILFNLISNAIKFTPSEGSVSLKLVETETGVEIQVIDTGCGIPTEADSQLFEKFYQSRSKGRPVKKGFGIGLYLSRKFTEEHHGTLTYKSEVNQGTTFQLTLLKGKDHFPPEVISTEDSSESLFLEELVDENPVLNADTPVEEEFKPDNIFTESKTILTIDDDKEIRNYIRSVFSPQYIVYEAADGNEGMTVVKEKTPDLVICDVMMPGMSGIEWCNWLKQDPALSYIPVILLTASSSPENKLKGLGCGADDYICKPFEKDMLLARVANLLTTRHNLRSYFYNEITLQSKSIAISEEYKVFLQKCMEIVEKHITDDNFNIKVLASEIGMSHSNLYRKVKSMSGYNINSFIRLIRLRKAAEILINSDLQISEVAIKTGFSNVKYFRIQFVKLYGVNPSDFAKRNRAVFKKRINVNL
ncbi:MAG: two-component regulator propeller domain-containing protein [Bacteroidota bacterium]|nr:two-component regulator propeller domain-containing protein [Bacteroidota bacterium]